VEENFRFSRMHLHIKKNDFETGVSLEENKHLSADSSGTT
jgi:hypothetical protein